jgi:RNA polymerase subunit RPABC4/transcription elongation factor Spt4
VNGFYPVLNEIHDKAAKELPLIDVLHELIAQETAQLHEQRSEGLILYGCGSYLSGMRTTELFTFYGDTILSSHWRILMCLYEWDRDIQRLKIHSEKTVDKLKDIEDDQPVIDMFSHEFGATIRSCIHCGVLIAGGATRCGFCAYRFGARREGWWDPVWKIMKRASCIARKVGLWKPDNA